MSDHSMSSFNSMMDRVWSEFNINRLGGEFRSIYDLDSDTAPLSPVSDSYGVTGIDPGDGPLNSSTINQPQLAQSPPNLPNNNRRATCRNTFTTTNAINHSIIIEYEMLLSEQRTLSYQFRIISDTINELREQIDDLQYTANYIKRILSTFTGINVIGLISAAVLLFSYLVLLHLK